MKSSSGWQASGTRQSAAFTLIELLTVMAIILILAGLIINIAGSANYNSAKARATGEVHAIATALENYKTDNGVYPPDPNTPTDPTASPSNLLNAQTDFEPTNTRYTINSQYLYQVLSGFPVTVGTTPTTGTTMSKAYMPFTTQQLKAVNSGDAVSTTNQNMYIIDPFGFSYGYSTIYAATVASNNAKNPPDNTPVTVGYNPTFDLWSTAGYSSSGKSMPSPALANSTAAAVHSSLWVKNW